VLAPIVVFVYNRPDRAKSVIESIAKNPEAKDSELFVFSDGPKNEKQVVNVEKVREYIDAIEDKKRFKSVHISKATKNKGLASSIIDGVDKVIRKYGKVIVVEDDNIVALDFLDYMNRGLEFYEKNPNIWAISGFSRKMTLPEDYHHDVFLMQRVSSYTWACWLDRWTMVDWSLKGVYPGFLFNHRERKRFDKYGADRSLMLDAQVTGKINSWAIRFEYYMMKNNMYSIMPAISRAKCTGNDGSGTHGKREIHSFDAELSDGSRTVAFENVETNEMIRKEYIKPYHLSILRTLSGNSEYIARYYWGRLNGK